MSGTSTSLRAAVAGGDTSAGSIVSTASWRRAAATAGRGVSGIRGSGGGDRMIAEYEYADRAQDGFQSGFDGDNNGGRTGGGRSISSLNFPGTGIDGGHGSGGLNIQSFDSTMSIDMPLPDDWAEGVQPGDHLFKPTVAPRRSSTFNSSKFGEYVTQNDIRAKFPDESNVCSAFASNPLVIGAADNASCKGDGGGGSGGISTGIASRSTDRHIESIRAAVSLLADRGSKPLTAPLRLRDRFGADVDSDADTDLTSPTAQSGSMPELPPPPCARLDALDAAAPCTISAITSLAGKLELVNVTNL